MSEQWKMATIYSVCQKVQSPGEQAVSHANVENRQVRFRELCTAPS